MNKKYTLWISFCFTAFLLLSSVPGAKATVPTNIPNRREITIASIGIPDTLDPQWLYDTSSAEVCMQVYDTLIGFDWEDPATFTPKLATNWYEATPEEGYAMKIVFELRDTGVEWHDGTVSDGADLARHVEYTFERWMLLDRSGGPTWMIFEALFGPGNYHITDVPDTINSVNAAVGRSGNLVWFNFVTEYPLAIFYQVVAQSWASIINKEWAAAQGAWNGVYADWEDYYDPPYSPFDEPDPVMMGTGPFQGPPATDPEFGSAYMDYIAEMWRLIRHRNYWRGWPAPGCSDYLNAIKEITMYDFSERKLWFLSNDPAAQADLIYIPRANIYDPDLVQAIRDSEVQYLGNPKKEGGLPNLSMSAAFFNWAIPDNSPYAGDFKLGTGIPKDFFVDDDVRYAFAYAFDWDEYITEVFLGEATQPATPLIKGLGYDDLYNALNEPLCYYADEDKCRTHLQNAIGGALWEEGFKMTITYNEGNVPRRVAAETLEENIEAFNAERPGKTAFDINVLEVIWDTYLEDLINYPYFRAKMAIFVIGWLADYPDPHNFFFPYMHTYGDFTYFQSYSNPAADALMEAEITETDPAVRAAIFGDLMAMWYTELPSLPLVQATGRHYERAWVQGWYYNTIEPGNNYYVMWKGLDGDPNGDGAVTTADGGYLSGRWTYPLLGVPKEAPEMLGYDRSADINMVPSLAWLLDPPELIRADEGLQYPSDPGLKHHGKYSHKDYIYDVEDIAGMAVPKLGFVDIFDVGLIQRYFGDAIP